MTTREVINKLALELAFKTGDLEDMAYYKKYLQMALSIGVEHFTRKMEEVVAMNRDGRELGRFKSADDAAKKLGLIRGNIYLVLQKRRVYVHGIRFFYVRDLELIKREKEQEVDF